MFCLGGFKLFSPDTAHTSGVFRSIFSQNRARVCEFFNVHARDYCGLNLHDPNMTMDRFFRFVQEERSRALILDYFDIDGTYIPG